MTPNPYVKILLALIVCAAFFISGYYVEHLRLVAYQERVSAEGKIQEQHNKDLLKERELSNAKNKADYDNQLVIIKRLYYSSSSSMPKPSSTLVSVNGYTTDPVFAELCANTTAQLNGLRQWVQDQVGLQ